MEGDSSYSLVLQFDDQSPSFAFGFQAGQIWQMTKSRAPFETSFSGENLELIQRMPTRCEYEFIITDIGSGWYALDACPKELL